ncbi:putative nuclease HARBI1 [Dermacentor silvarum]|uniref:putative nuclease HARBI1 n=1 Tax=Dermacentor silvarum TaxID=543639 RepID=UPI0018976FE2|nr:putative nuclease HARBI1 [Dermacentor silvarum]
MAAPLIAMAVALRRRRRGHGEPDNAFDMPDDHFRQHFHLSKETVRLLCEDLAGELKAERATGLSVERKVSCALRFFATGSFQASVGSKEMIRVSQSTVSECVRRVAKAVVNPAARKKSVHFPKTSEEKAAVKEGFLRRCAIPGVIGCVDGSLVAIIAAKGEHKAAFMCRKGYYARTTLHICDADMRILTVYPMRPGSDYDSFLWRTTWLRRRFQAARIANPAEYLISDSGYPLDPWLLTPVPGHLPMQNAEKYNRAHAAMRSVVERCIGLLKSRFRCRQRYRILLYEPEHVANIVAACAVLHTQSLAV